MNNEPFEPCTVCGRRHYPKIVCTDKPFDPGIPFELRPKKEMIRVVTKLGHYFDMDRPADFNMISFVTLIKANGHILNEHMFQPLDQIVSIFIFNVDSPPKMPGEVIRFPGAAT